MAVKRAPRRRKTLAQKLAPELRARMVEALTDVARERRKGDERLANLALGHALTLADQYLILTGEVEP